MDLDLVFLGTSGSAPTAARAPAAVLVRRGGDRLLFDCGEGTQRQLMRSTVGLPDLEDVFVTHFHADHYLGLPGLVKTFQLRQRDAPLRVHGPVGLLTLFGGLRRIFGRVTYPLELIELRPGEAIERDGYRILAYPVDHGRAALGYAIEEPPRPGRFDVEAADRLGVPPGRERGVLQRGGSVTLADGSVVEPAAVLGAERPGRRVLLPGDTAPTETVRVLAEGADVLVHEATFTDDERDRAAETLHTTAHQAAEIARDAGVRLLALSHVSPRFAGPELAREARLVFPQTVVPRDFDVIEVPFAERGSPRLVRRGARPARGQSRPESAADDPPA